MHTTFLLSLCAAALRWPLQDGGGGDGYSVTASDAGMLKLITMHPLLLLKLLSKQPSLLPSFFRVLWELASRRGITYVAPHGMYQNQAPRDSQRPRNKEFNLLDPYMIYSLIPY